MIAKLPAVQWNCRHVHITMNARLKRDNKRIANRRHRRALNRVTRKMKIDPESFYDEGFNAPSFSNWDID